MLYLVLATICFSLSFGIIKSSLVALRPELVVFLRLLIASLVFLPFVKKSKKHLLALLIGIIQFGIMYLCFIKSFQYFKGSEVALFTTTTPIFVVIFSSFFGEKFKPAYILCVLLSVAGAIVATWGNLPVNIILKGILLIEASNLSFALGQVLWKKYINEDEITLISSAYFGASLFVLPFLLLNVNFSSLVISKMQILAILYLGIIPTGLGFWLWNKGSKFVKFSTLAIMNNLKIPVSILFSILIFRESVNYFSFLTGSMVIILSILLMNYLLKKEN
ncbi:MAG: hypothetical protein E7Z91_02445 [Cyanobacteria bacterium SIG30]|nr:hypothetical protein [Cyanobacteria bacterium SIG30]